MPRVVGSLDAAPKSPCLPRSPLRGFPAGRETEKFSATDVLAGTSTSSAVSVLFNEPSIIRTVLCSRSSASIAQHFTMLVPQPCCGVIRPNRVRRLGPHIAPLYFRGILMKNLNSTSTTIKTRLFPAHRRLIRMYAEAAVDRLIAQRKNDGDLTKISGSNRYNCPQSVSRKGKID